MSVCDFLFVHYKKKNWFQNGVVLSAEAPLALGYLKIEGSIHKHIYWLSVRSEGNAEPWVKCGKWMRAMKASKQTKQNKWMQALPGLMVG